MNLETLCKVLNVLLGMLLMYVLQFGWAHYKKWRGSNKPLPKINKHIPVWMAMAVVLAGSLFVGVEVNTTQHQVRDVTVQTQDCYRQFSEALQARSRIAAEDTIVLRKQRDALIANDEAMFAWISILLSPPPEIAALPQQDPRRQAWGISVTNDFNRVMTNSLRIIAEARQQEVNNDSQRAQHPLPEPNCGR